MAIAGALAVRRDCGHDRGHGRQRRGRQVGLRRRLPAGVQNLAVTSPATPTAGFYSDTLTYTIAAGWARNARSPGRPSMIRSDRVVQAGARALLLRWRCAALAAAPASAALAASAPTAFSLSAVGNAGSIHLHGTPVACSTARCASGTCPAAHHRDPAAGRYANASNGNADLRHHRLSLGGRVVAAERQPASPWRRARPARSPTR